MCTEIWLEGEKGEVHIPSGKRCKALRLFETLKSSNQAEYKRILARLMRIVDFGREGEVWFKKLTKAEDLHQLSGTLYRLILVPYPARENNWILLHAFKKQSDKTDRKEIENALKAREECLRRIGKKKRGRQ